MVSTQVTISNCPCPCSVNAVLLMDTVLSVSLYTENALRSLLEALTSPPYAPMQHLEREQALAKQFAEILHFTLSFDELKVNRHTLSRDTPEPED